MWKKLLAGILIVCIIFAAGTFLLKKLYPLDYYDITAAECGKYTIDPLFIQSIIKAESNFKPDITSSKGAMGLMQVRGDTGTWCAEKMGIENFSIDSLYQPETNIKIGIWYFDYLVDHFGGDYVAAVAAYNAGMGNVNKWFENEEYSVDGQTLTKVPFEETSRYINKVLNNYKIYQLLY